MNENESKLLTVGELASRVGVSVRTLQFYDKMGILVPQYSEGGRRLYDRDNILRLHQILFYKSFGFSLSEIRDRLLPAESAEQLGTILRQQHAALVAQIAHLQEIADLMKQALNEIHSGGYVGTDNFVTMMELMGQGYPYAFILSYFSDDQVKHIQTRFIDPQDAADFTRLCQEAFAELIVLYRTGADPVGPEGQALASRWWEMVTTFTQGNPGLLKTMISAGSDIDNWPDEASEFKLAIKEFLELAFAEYIKNNGIQIQDDGGDANDQ